MEALGCYKEKKSRGIVMPASHCFLARKEPRNTTCPTTSLAMAWFHFATASSRFWGMGPITKPFVLVLWHKGATCALGASRFWTGCTLTLGTLQKHGTKISAKRPTQFLLAEVIHPAPFPSYLLHWLIRTPWHRQLDLARVCKCRAV